MNPKFEKLKKLMEIMQNDTVTPAQLKGFLEMVLATIKTSKDNLESISQTNIKELNSALKYIEQCHKETSSEIKEIKSKTVTDFQSSIKEAKVIIKELKSIKLKDGKDGRDGADGKDGEKGEKGDSGSPDTPEEITSKLESLEGEARLDAKSIKNLERFLKTSSKPNGGGWRNLFQLHDIELTDVTDNDILQYDSATSTWKNVTPQAIEDVDWGEIGGTITNQTDLINYIDSKIATVDTLNEISILSNTTAKSLYQMTSGANVEFRASDATTLFYLDDTNKQARFYAGTASLPGITINGDTNTGIFSDTVDTLSIGVAGSQVVRVTSAGLAVGVTPTINKKFQTLGGASTSNWWMQNNSNGESAWSNAAPGIELTAGTMNTTAKYTPFIKFGSTDADLATTNPKFNAFMVGRATEAYGFDSRTGMSLDFGVSFTAQSTGSAAFTGMSLAALTASTAGLGINTETPSATIEARAITEQLRLSYDTSNRLSITVDSAGIPTFAPTGNSMVFKATAPAYIINVHQSDSTATAYRLGTYADSAESEYLFNAAAEAKISGRASSYIGLTAANYFGVGVSTPLAKLHANAPSTMSTVADTDGALRLSASSVTTAYLTAGLSTNGYPLLQGGRTSDSTAQALLLNPFGANVVIGLDGAGSAKLHVEGTTEQLRLGYDTTNRLSVTVAATGSTTFALNGTSPVFTFSQSVLLPSGTVSAPAIGFASETNSGWYRSGAGVINLSVLGTSVLSASSSALTSTNVILAPSGTVSAPSFSFASETNSGWYRAAAGTIALSIGGTQKISVTATETRSDNNFLAGAAGSNLTVLSTTPRIQGVTTSGIAISSIGVADGTNNRRIGMYVNQTSGELGISYTRSSGAVPFYIKDVSTNRLLIDVNGNVGINLGAATTADTNLHVLGTGFPVGLFERQVTNTNSGGSALGVRTTSTGDMVDGFGTGFTLQIEDTAGVANPIANFFASRNGADNTGKLAINVYNAGSVVEAITALNTGSIGMGASPDASAQLDVTSTSKGFLPPRMTGAQGEAIGTPAIGLMIYATSAGSGDITAAGWWGYNGANWVQLG